MPFSINWLRLPCSKDDDSYFCLCRLRRRKHWRIKRRDEEKENEEEEGEEKEEEGEDEVEEEEEEEEEGGVVLLLSVYQNMRQGSAHQRELWLLAGWSKGRLL